MRMGGLRQALVFRQQARNDGKPAFVRIFTHATQGFAMCGDYFCWVDNTCMPRMVGFFAYIS